MAIAIPTDIADYLGRDLTPEETRFATKQLEMTERRILERIPDLMAKITAGTVSEDTVRDIETEIVARIVKNPDGLTMETDGNYSYQMHEGMTGQIEISKEMWSRLGFRRGAFTIEPVISLPWES